MASKSARTQRELSGLGVDVKRHAVYIANVVREFTAGGWRVVRGRWRHGDRCRLGIASMTLEAAARQK
jgi:hypothetical protein